MLDDLDPMKSAAQKAARLCIFASNAGSARERGRQIQNKVCAWTYRWGFVSDRSLESIHPGRPRLGYELWKRGLLIRHKLPEGIRLLDGENVYSLSEDGFLIAERELSPLTLYHQRPTDRPGWSTMQHLLDLQRIAAALEFNPRDPSWRSEPETRATFHKLLVPDLFAILEDGTCHWVEWERSPKKDMNLDHWIQLLARRQAMAMSNREDRPASISRLDVIVPNEYQRERYERMFNRKVADQIVRDKDTRKLNKRTDTPRVEIQKYLADVVLVHTLDEFLWA